MSLDPHLWSSTKHNFGFLHRRREVFEVSFFTDLNSFFPSSNKCFFPSICLKGFEHFLAKKYSYFINILGTFSQHLDVLTNNNSIKWDLEFLLNLQSKGTTSDAHSWGQTINFCSASHFLSQQTKLWSPVTPSYPHFQAAFVALWFDFRSYLATPGKAKQTSSLQ